jgi:acetoin utilization protein AcuC
MHKNSPPSVAVISGPALAEYHFGEEHAFGPHRLQAFLDGMQHMQLMQQVDWLEPVDCHLQSLLSFHHPDYIEMVRYASSIGKGYLDSGDTPARKGIFKAACTVVGSVVRAVDEVMQQRYRRVFVPIAGMHHSYRDKCRGFCVFNDIAIAIERLKQHYQLNRILYVDIDAHHGDGVYYSYDSDPAVYLVDVHEDGRFLYPGSGAKDETGREAGRGLKMNIPMPMYANDSDFAAIWAQAETFMHSIQPQFIIFQCGADGMKGDPITHLQYSQQSYQLAIQTLCRLADRYCAGHLIALGGGGYNAANISLAWPTVIKSML